ncbi:MAG: holo-ACP synthase [Rickettsiales bacterium]|jgi:holo-[acyl-carrier protein] synthase|nr:holo-ACP synthase [Rickettsiales bacterium]
MILGLGIDLLDSHRVEKLLEKFGDKFIDRVLSVEEIRIFSTLSSSNRKIKFLAKRFSTKESVFKAVGMGLGRGLVMKNISVLNDDFGRPYVVLDYISTEFICNFYHKNIENIRFDVSITDEGKFVNSVAVISEVV